ncbi:MAG TPA: acetate--CoA ligase family protein [Ktedonobacteraceae bacterium]|nr:acetate--CoA ligase family protein [Ktedonobacteraceae bacterium]
MDRETARISPERLRRLFHPRSIALVGATDRSRWSISTYQNLKTFSFPGSVYCVNPNYEVVHGEPAVKRLADIPEPVDLAYIMVPTSRVFSIVEEAAAASIPNLVILTAGFGEVGAQGLQLEQDILAFARQHDMTLLGPNGNGFVNVTAQITPYGLPLLPPLTRGPVGVVLQSGALASAVVALAQARHIGLSLLVSMGNETMISATDVIEYLIEDEATRVIAVFLESIRRPDYLRRVARKALAYGKPIVALKVGTSDTGARTARAHTGALVGNDAVNDAAFRQLGIVRVSSLEDLLTTAGLLGYYGPLNGRRMGVVTPSGGACDILSDRAQEEGIALPDFAPQTVENLKAVLPNFSTVHNPLDVTGYIVVDRMLLQNALNVVVQDPNLDFILCLTDPPRVAPPQVEPTLAQYTMLGETIRSSRVPIVLISNTGIDISPFGRTICDTADLHFVGGMEHGMTALGHALRWYETRRQTSAELDEQEAASPVRADTPPAGQFTEFEARQLLQAHDIPVAPGMLATSAEEAVTVAQTLGFPVVMKIQSPDILHKSDIGGVLLHLSTEQEVRQGFQTLLENVNSRRPGARIAGVLVSPMRTEGIELLVGVIRDAVWGQVVTVGLGGIWVELFNDTSVRLLPVTRTDIQQMLAELRGAALLKGSRGQPVADTEHLTDIILRITHLAQALGDRLEALEINPLLVHGSQIEALDVLIAWNTNLS